MKIRIALIKLFFLFIIIGVSHHLFAQQVGISSVVITFESAPTVAINKSSLKYNKDFALSFHVEDASKDVYTHAFKYLNGGTIDGVTYPGVFYTDGCGHNVPFKMGTSLFSFNDAQDTDLHDPDGTNTDTYLTWPEIIEMYQAGWGIYNQGLTSSNSGDADYLIGRNQSYLKLKTQAATNNGINTNILVNPQNDISFSSPAFNKGYRAAYRGYTYGVPYLDVADPLSITDLDSLKMGMTHLIGTESLGGLADTLNAHSNSSVKPWASAFNKSINDADNGYTFSVFKFYIDYIATRYGKDSTDNVWMTNEEEVLDYLIVKREVGMNTEILGNQLLITFTGTLPTDLRYYALSLNIDSDVKITGISVNGGKNNSYFGIGTTHGLVNMNWDGEVVTSKTANAEHFVSVAETTESQNDVLIAMDYVNMLDPGQTMIDFRNRLCAIPGAELPDGWCDCSFSLGNDTLICYGDSITITAPLGVSYSWNTGATTRSIRVSPTQQVTLYTVTVYNDQGCYASDTKAVIVNSPEFASVATSEDTVCPGFCTNLTVTAPSGSNYLWSNGKTTKINTVCPDTTTTYNVRVTNAYGCVDVDTITIHTYPEPEIQVTNDTSICKNKCITLTASGGTQYLWSTDETTSSIEVCPEITTTYYVTATNANNCSVTDSVKVTVWGLPTISLESDTNICINDCIDLTASGGSTYLWSTGDSTASIRVCPEDTTTYIINVISETGCSGTDSVTINVLPVPTPVVSNDTTVCPNTCVRLGASGGVSYLWSTGETTDTIEVCPAVPTKYYVTVFNDNGCGVIDSIMVNHLVATNANAGDDQTICPGETATLLATGGYEYLWSTGEQTNSIHVTPIDTTMYLVTVTNDNGCSANDTVIVNVRPRPVASAGNDTTICPGTCTILEASGGVDYLWDDGTEGAQYYVCPTQDTNYFVTVYDEFGCTANDTVQVKIAETSVVDFSGLLNVYCSNNSGSILEPDSVGGIFEGPGINNNIFYPAAAGAGTHQITYRLENENGCWSTSSKTTIVYAVPEINLGNDTTLCLDASLELAVDSGLDSYLWSNGSTDFSTTIDAAGLGAHVANVQLIATQNGCVAIDEIQVTFTSCVGIEDLNKSGIYIYPNPSTGQFNIVFNGQEEELQIEIINLQGQVIYRETLTNCNQPECIKSIDLSGYNKGIYIIRFLNKNFIRSAKLLIN